MGLKINDVEVIPLTEDFNDMAGLEEYKALPRPKEDFAKWLVKAGYVRNAPIPLAEKRKPRPATPKEM